jgi:hypothetical protein
MTIELTKCAYCERPTGDNLCPPCQKKLAWEKLVEAISRGSR